MVWNRSCRGEKMTADRSHNFPKPGHESVAFEGKPIENICFFQSMPGYRCSIISSNKHSGRGLILKENKREAELKEPAALGLPFPLALCTHFQSAGANLPQEGGRHWHENETAYPLPSRTLFVPSSSFLTLQSHCTTKAWK